jgi:DNA polymerase-3 subunit delta
MSLFTFYEFSETLKKNKIISPMYIFAGEEFYLINLGLNKLEQVLNVDILDREIFYIKDTAITDILGSVQTYPFYGAIREIIIKDLDKMTTTDSDSLIKYLDNNVIKTSCFILIYYNNYKNDTIIKRQEFIKKCISSRICTVVNCRPLLHNELKKFIKDEFAKRNKTISNEAILLLSTKFGKNLFHISNEIEKLTLLIGNETSAVTINDCNKIFKNINNSKFRTLSLSIIAKNLSVALCTIDQLFIDNQDPLVILSIIASSIRKVIYAKGMLHEQKIHTTEIAKILNIRQNSINSFFKKIQQHSIQQLKTSFKMLLNLDIEIKTAHNHTTIRTLMEEIIIFICR